eukprot:scaffold11022_cov157-Isochrysis_galbana.AAC.1
MSVNPVDRITKQGARAAQSHAALHAATLDARCKSAGRQTPGSQHCQHNTTWREKPRRGKAYNASSVNVLDGQSQAEAQCTIGGPRPRRRRWWRRLGGAAAPIAFRQRRGLLVCRPSRSNARRYAPGHARGRSSARPTLRGKAAAPRRPAACSCSP